MQLSRLFAATALSLALTAPAFADHDRSESAEAKALLARAVSFMEQEGAAKAMCAFNNPKGEFVKKDLYVFAFDVDGRYFASGSNPNLVGTSVLTVRDAAGKALFKDMVELAKAKGEGSVDYMWLNRTNNKVEPKHSYIKRVGDLVVGVGYYEPRK